MEKLLTEIRDELRAVRQMLAIHLDEPSFLTKDDAKPVRRWWRIVCAKIKEPRPKNVMTLFGWVDWDEDCDPTEGD